MDTITPFLAKALRYLSIRPRSEKEIREYLLGKNKPQKKTFVAPSAEIIHAVIEKLKEMRFVNDTEFAKSWIRSRTAYKPKSLSMLKLELKQKGIAPEIIEEALESREEKKDDKTMAIDILSHKKKKYDGMEKQEVLQKAGGMLARKGFSYDVIKSAIDEVFNPS